MAGQPPTAIRSAELIPLDCVLPQKIQRKSVEMKRQCPQTLLRTLILRATSISTFRYLNIQANYMYHYGGTNPWGNMVRSCLICMYNHGVDAAAAHSFCYANASSHVPFWDMVWGYAAAINAGLSFLGLQPAKPYENPLG
jgi:hypothetical protein